MKLKNCLKVMGLLVKWKGKFYKVEEEDIDFLYLLDVDESLKYQREVIWVLPKSAKRTAKFFRQMQVVAKESLKGKIESQLKTIKNVKA